MNTVSEPKVMRSSAGYYVGKEVIEDGIPVPYSRNSQYFRTKAEAKKALLNPAIYNIER